VPRDFFWRVPQRKGDAGLFLLRCNLLMGVVFMAAIHPHFIYHFLVARSASLRESDIDQA